MRYGEIKAIMISPIIISPKSQITSPVHAANYRMQRK